MSHGLAAAVRVDVLTRLLHWVVAAFLVAAFGLAWSFSAMSPGTTAGRLVEVHRSVGLTVLALMGIRLVWRLFHPLPPLPPGPDWERWLAKAVQAGLYAALIAQPFLGWAASSAQGDTVSYLGLIALPDLVATDPDRGDALFALHKTVGFVILALLALHVAGALRHALVKRDGVVQRMITG